MRRNGLALARDVSYFENSRPTDNFSMEPAKENLSYSVSFVSYRLIAKTRWASPFSLLVSSARARTTNTAHEATTPTLDSSASIPDVPEPGNMHVLEHVELRHSSLSRSSLRTLITAQHT